MVGHGFRKGRRGILSCLKSPQNELGAPSQVHRRDDGLREKLAEL